MYNFWFARNFLVFLYVNGWLGCFVSRGVALSFSLTCLFGRQGFAEFVLLSVYLVLNGFLPALVQAFFVIFVVFVVWVKLIELLSYTGCFVRIRGVRCMNTVILFYCYMVILLYGYIAIWFWMVSCRRWYRIFSCFLCFWLFIGWVDWVYWVE